MNRTETRVNRVLEIRQGPEQHILHVYTDRSGELWLNTRDPGRVKLEFLSSSLTEKDLLAIEFDPQTKKIVWVHYATIDMIGFLPDPGETEQEIRVHALMRPSLLALRKDNPRFDELYALLAKAHANRSKGIKAALAIRGNYVLDVVLIEPPPNN